MSTKSDHPITPPPWLVKHWDEMIQRAIEAAFQAGADQELEACCEWFKKEGWNSCHPEALVATRRPKSLSLKEQALEQLESVQCLLDMHKLRSDTIRRALEALDE